LVVLTDARGCCDLGVEIGGVVSFGWGSVDGVITCVDSCGFASWASSLFVGTGSSSVEFDGVFDDVSVVVRLGSCGRWAPFTKAHNSLISYVLDGFLGFAVAAFFFKRSSSLFAYN